jgi:hypothetical protein
MLDIELELYHLAQVFEIWRHGYVTILVFNWSHEVAEDIIAETAVAILAQVSCCLMKILGSPKCTIRNVNIDGEASCCTSN